MANSRRLLNKLKENFGSLCYTNLLNYLDAREQELKDELVDSLDPVVAGKIKFIVDFKEELRGISHNGTGKTIYFE